MSKFMQNEFVFGVQYVRGMSPSPTSWDDDMRNIKKMGFNTIRVWLNWGTVEPRPGMIDYAWLERMKTLAAKHGLQVIYLFHIHSAPEWACSTHKSAWYVNRLGLPFEPVVRQNTPSGGFPGLCPDHAITLSLEESFIERVVKFLGDSAYAYEPINEPHSWIDRSFDPTMNFCYCEASRAKFRIWLQKRYKTLEALSESWGRPFCSWEDVRPNTWTVGYIDKMDFRQFQMENIAELVARRANIIRKLTSRPVIAHSFGGGCCTHPRVSDMAFDDWKNAAPLDAWGCSGFPNSPHLVAPLGLTMDSSRSAAEGKPCWQSELTSGNNGYRFDHKEISPELLSLFSWESVSHGISGLLYWQWRLEIYGDESMHYGLTDRAGNPTERAFAVAKIGKVLTSHSKLMLSAKPPKPEVAILFHPRAILLDGAMHKNNSISSDALVGYYRAFWEKDVPVEILHSEKLTAETLALYKLVVVPSGYVMSEEMANLLKDYVAQGGTLYADPLTASWNENARLEPSMPGRGLDKVFGTQENKLWNAPQDTITITAGHDKYDLKGSYVYESWNLLGKSTAYAKDEQGQILLTRNKFKKGLAFLSGIALGNMSSQRLNDDTPIVPDAARLFCKIACEAGVSFPERDANVRFRKLLLPDGRELHFYMNQKETPTTCQLHMPGQSLITKKKLAKSVNLGKYGVELLLVSANK
ncbi:MAG: beta-galactosidase [Victivallales bacterium]|nr:beta-galactosidase [Victivallales bacterium]